MKDPNISAVAHAGGQTVSITWNNGKIDRVDLSTLVANLAGLEPLDNAPTFAAVQVGEDGWSLLWPSGIEIGTDTLWRMASEQRLGSRTQRPGADFITSKKPPPWKRPNPRGSED